ncbi:MAG: leucine-rich repeat protein [Prevotella sp.]|nr:leucine-rich repeat protein [Prevotella sp.]
MASTLGSGGGDDSYYRELYGHLLKRDVSVFEDDTAEEIGAYAFGYWATNYGTPVSLQSVSLPNCHTIGRYAFATCLGLSEVYLPNVVNVGHYAFSSCEYLPELSLPYVTVVNIRIVFNCFRMKLIDLPSATTVSPTDSYAFQGLGERRSDYDTDEYGNVYKCLIRLTSMSMAQVEGGNRFPWSAPATTKFQCSDGYIIHDGSQWVAVAE